MCYRSSVFIRILFKSRRTLRACHPAAPLSESLADAEEDRFISAWREASPRVHFALLVTSGLQ
jgi:hypothetical protein